MKGLSQKEWTVARQQDDLDEYDDKYDPDWADEEDNIFAPDTIMGIPFPIAIDIMRGRWPPGREDAGFFDSEDPFGGEDTLFGDEGPFGDNEGFFGDGGPLDDGMDL